MNRFTGGCLALLPCWEQQVARAPCTRAGAQVLDVLTQ
jgi:hypothetical protein